MTLNLTIISRSWIHQSADFRISKTARDTDGKWIELESNAPKIVSLRFQRWSGFLTYCGIGLWNGKRTDQYASEWITELSGTDVTFRDTVEKIIQRGTQWISRINQESAEPFRHTFVVAGFEGGVPIYAVASNAQSLTGYIPYVPDRLVSDVRATKDQHILITGIREAVSEALQERLRSIVRSGASAQVIRHELAEANRIASESDEAKNGISPSCLVYSINEYGAGSGEVRGDVDGPLLPRNISDGIDMNKMLAEVLRKVAPGAKLVQTAYATTESNRAEIDENIVCEPAFSANDCAAFEDIGALNEYWLSLHSINETGAIVGQLRRPLETTPHAFVKFPGGEPQDLGTLGGPVSNALAINAKNEIVGTAQIDDRATHAFVWKEGDGMLDLGTLGGRDSVARWINSDSVIVGNSFIGDGEPESENERAFLWSKSNGMLNLGDALEGWSRAVAINNNGVVLGWQQRRGVVCGFVWSEKQGATDLVGLRDRAYYPCAISDAGLVVGEGDDDSGKRRTFTWTQDSGLKLIGVPEDFHPTDIDNRGNILGNIYSHPWARPGLYNLGYRTFVELPSLHNHQMFAKAMNRSGIIIGSAYVGSWKHQHPLVWRKH